MKSTFKMTAVATLAAALVATAASAATTVSGTASAVIIGNLSVVQQAPLNFGTFSSGTTAGTINSFGATTGGVTVMSIGAPAAFQVTGNPNTNFFITSPASVTLTSGANTMPAALTAPTASTLDNTGSRVFNVLGTLTVAANKPAGNYTGTYNVSVNY